MSVTRCCVRECRGWDHHQQLVANADRVPCYADTPHDGHLWTFDDDYPPMLCQGIEDGSWLPL